MMDKQVHVLAIAYPAQGHIVPLMKLSKLIADHGIKVTIVYPESIHARALAVLSSEKGESNGQIRVVSIPDGVDEVKNKEDRYEISNSMLRVMPGEFEELIRKLNSSEDEKIDCIIADSTVGWAFESAEKMGVKTAMFWPTTVEGISLSLEVPQLIDDGIIDHNNGPLLSSNTLENPAGSLWHVDLITLSWLDEQPTKSVIYVSFGSIANLSQSQFEELALGLELLGQPFLWVIRSDFLNGSTINYPDGFLDRTANRGKIVKWAPQEKVLCHPSVACFLSHCGWNSTMEGMYNGVPFMCWPYFADRFHIRSYICEFWKVGLGLTPGENGIISRYDIEKKIERLLSDTEIKERALKLKDMARTSLDEGGSSWKNLKLFIEQLKS